jgi:hypothetical protein
VAETESGREKQRREIQREREREVQREREGGRQRLRPQQLL